MDSNIINFLESNNLLHLQQYFEAFDFDTFKKLEPHHLRELIEIPKLRILFEIKLNELNKNSDTSQLPDQTCQMFRSVQKDNAFVDELGEFINDTFLSNDITEVNVTIPSPSQSTAGPSSDEARNSENEIETIYPTIWESPVFKEMADLDVDIVYAKFIKNQLLEAADRGKLSRCIVKFILRKSAHKLISRTEFQNAAGTIVATFPGENVASYYIPSSGDESASGRLYQTYKCIRDELGEAGMIRRRVICKKKIQQDEPDESVAETGTDNQNVADVPLSIEYLTTHTDNEKEILQHWCNSRSERFRLVGQLRVAEYFTKFPLLSMADGFKWLDLDFAQLYPTAKNAVDKWTNFAPKLLSYALQKAKKNKTIRDVINAHDNSDAAQLLLSFKILPWILRWQKGGKKKEKGKTSVRPNQLEISDNFIVHFNTENDDKRKTVSFIEVKLIGSNSKYHTFVNVDNVQYVFEDILSGIDCAFKLFYIFNLKFPQLCEHIWEFLDLAIYEINTVNNKAPNFEIFSDIQRQPI